MKNFVGWTNKHQIKKKEKLGGTRYGIPSDRYAGRRWHLGTESFWSVGPAYSSYHRLLLLLLLLLRLQRREVSPRRLENGARRPATEPEAVPPLPQKERTALWRGSHRNPHQRKRSPASCLANPASRSGPTWQSVLIGVLGLLFLLYCLCLASKQEREKGKKIAAF